MAETKVKTRIYIRHDTEENWESSSTILQEGELGYSVKTETNDNGEEVTTYILKIGNGENIWSELPDTHIYYNKEDIDNLLDNISSDLESSKSSISEINSTIENMNYDYDTDETSDKDKKDYVTSVSEKEGVISVTKENFDTTVTENSQNAVTGEAVSTKINETIESLKYEDADGSETTNKYVISVSEEKGVISVTKGEIDDTVTEDSKNLITSGAVYSEVQEKISNLVNASIVVKDSYEDLVSEDGEKGIIYLVPCNHDGADSPDTTSKDTYDEYIWIDPTTDEEAVGYYEKIGNTDIDLSDYVKTEELEEKINEAKEALEEGAEAIKASLEKEISEVKGIIGADDEYDVETDGTLISRISNLESTTEEQGEAISSINETLNGENGEDGLVKNVKDLQSTVGNEDEGLVKDVADNTVAIETNASNIEKNTFDIEANSSDIKELQQKAVTNVYLENGVLYYETLTDDTAEETP